jgi:dihydroflavonol-4-reductase
MSGRVFLTGGTGLVGGHVLQEYVRDGWEATVLTRDPEQARRRFLSPRVKYVTGDLTRPETFGDGLRGHDLLVHCGALHPPWAPGLEDILHRTNVEATRSILTLAERAGIRRLVYTSTAKTIGWDPRRAMQDESVPYDFGIPDNEYGRAKARAEDIVMTFPGALDIVVLNPTAVLGAHDHVPTPTGRFVQKAIREPIHFHVEMPMQFVDARDVARAHLAAATQGAPRERHILAAPPIALQEVFATVDDFIGWDRPKISIPFALVTPLGSVFEFLARTSHFHAPVTRASAAVARRKTVLNGVKSEKAFGFTYIDVRTSLRESAVWFMGSCPSGVSSQHQMNG